MKKTKLHPSHFRTLHLSMLCSLLFFSCAGKVEKNVASLKYKTEKSRIHEDSISMRAETLPEFRVSPHDKKFQGNQISGVVRTVFQDKKRNYWFGTQNGLCRKDQNGLVYFDLKDSNGQSVTVHVIREDHIGNIWIGFGGGIAKYDGAYFTVFHQKDILTSSGLWSMTIDTNDTLWIGTTSGVFTFNGEELIPFDIPEGKVDPTKGVSTTKMVNSIMEDSKGKMWFGTNGGAYFYDGKTLNNISKKDGLLSDFVHHIMEDSKGNYWISTSEGLFEYDGSSLINKSESLYKTDEGIGCILEDKNGTIWFTANRRDIYSYKDKKFTKIRVETGDYSPMPFQIYQDQQDRLWFVGFKGAYRLEKDSFVNVTRNGPW